MGMTIRRATVSDIPALTPIMDAAIEELQRGFLNASQIESSKAIMGIDRQLIVDGTYYVVHIDAATAGCGGWSRRATLYGGDRSIGRNAADALPEGAAPSPSSKPATPGAGTTRGP